MRILVIGGTRFVGHHFTDAALRAGHDLTLFNRGQSDPGAFPDVERVTGDRDGGLEPLAGRTFDAVVDMCGYVPRVVRQSVSLLAPAAARYLFVSSISVYDDAALRPGYDEDAPIQVLADPDVEEITNETYGGLKALCEREVRHGFPGRALVIRPGLIVGPLDRSDRFTYWVRRLARGGDVLAPGSSDRPVQVIDARDLAAWMLRLVDAGTDGVFNATGPAAPLTFGDMLAAILPAVGGDARLVWVDERFLLDHGVEPWTDLPVWLPEAEQAADQCDVTRALRAGLTFRPLGETATETLEWDAGRARGVAMLAGLADDRERELLRAWRDERPRPSLPS